MVAGTRVRVYVLVSAPDVVDSPVIAETGSGQRTNFWYSRERKYKSGGHDEDHVKDGQGDQDPSEALAQLGKEFKDYARMRAAQWEPL